MVAKSCSALLLFGATGDLSKRMLLPSLFGLHEDGLIEPGLRIVGTARSEHDDAEFREFAAQALAEFLPEDRRDETKIASFLDRLSYQTLDASNIDGFSALATKLGDISCGLAIFLSTAPALFEATIEGLRHAGLAKGNVRIGLEKPLGNDLASSARINDAVAAGFDEKQIFRIDHYLGKEPVQNLMALRFANMLFEPLWNAANIDHVQITVSETVGLEGRKGFYDDTGALRDMVQNHLLQLLCIVAMEPPISLNPDDVRDEKLKVLRSLRKMDVAAIKRDTVRGQYTAGVSEGSKVPGYLQEADIPANSQTETFVALRAHIDNARWANVPFFLRTGKRLQKRQSEIIIEFTEQPFSIFGKSPSLQPNRLIISLQPEESIQLAMMVKEPGSGMNLHPVRLSLDLQETSSKRRADAYERLLMDVIKGRLTHFMRRDELEAAWTWIDPILAGWQALDEKPRNYAAGSWGPAASSALMAREDLTWFEES